MKKILLIVLLTSFSWGFGQTYRDYDNDAYTGISITMLMILRTGDDADVEDYLESENWKYFDGKEETENSEKVKVYQHNPSADLKSGHDMLYIYSSKRRHSNRIVLYVQSEDYFIWLLGGIQRFGGKLLSENKKDGFIQKVYQHGDDVIALTKTIEIEGNGEKSISWIIDISNIKDLQK